jgi:hypothetical protein
LVDCRVGINGYQELISLFNALSYLLFSLCRIQIVFV